MRMPQSHPSLLSVRRKSRPWLFRPRLVKAQASANLTNSLAPFRIFLGHGPAQSAPLEPLARRLAGQTQKKPRNSAARPCATHSPFFNGLFSSRPAPVRHPGAPTLAVFLCAAIVFLGQMPAWPQEGWRQWQRWEQWERWERPAAGQAQSAKGKEGKGGGQEHQAPGDGASAKRYCSPAEEKELLRLLAELRQPSLGARRPGRESEVRRKIRIARQLRRFDDCRAEDALRQLIKENACENRGTEEMICVAWTANRSLQEVTSKKDLKKLTPESPLDDQLAVIRKYGSHPHKNEFASHRVMEFLIEQADEKPEVYVPLLVEYFASCHDIIDVAREYPREADIGLRKGLESANPVEVWAAIDLARMLGKKHLFPQIFEKAFGDKNAFGQADEETVLGLRMAALGFFRQHEAEALPYYRAILFGPFPRIKPAVVSGIKGGQDPRVLALLREFAAWLDTHPDGAPPMLRQRLREKIARLEEAQR